MFSSTRNNLIALTTFHSSASEQDPMACGKTYTWMIVGPSFFSVLVHIALMEYSADAHVDGLKGGEIQEVRVENTGKVWER